MPDVVVPEPEAPSSGQQQEIRYVPIDIDESAVVDPVPLDAPRPDYPQMAIDRGIDGKVTVWATIDENGDVTVNEADGPPILRAAASDAVDDWKFRPGTRNGRPMERQFNVTITFAFTRGL